MKLFPRPWTGSRFEYLRAVLIGLFLVAGLAVAIQRRSWVVALVWLVLLAGAVVSWTHDLLKAMRRKS